MQQCCLYNQGGLYQFPQAPDILSHNVPIKQKPYRLSPPKQKVLKELLDEMLDSTVIEPLLSAWASPVVIEPKRTGKPRICVDYRKTSAKTQTDAYPFLPSRRFWSPLLQMQCSQLLILTLDSGKWR